MRSIQGTNVQRFPSLDSGLSKHFTKIQQKLFRNIVYVIANFSASFCSLFIIIVGMVFMLATFAFSLYRMGSSSSKIKL